MQKSQEALCPTCGEHIQGILREEHFCDFVDIRDLEEGGVAWYPADGPWRKTWLRCSGCGRRWQTAKTLLKSLKKDNQKN